MLSLLCIAMRKVHLQAAHIRNASLELEHVYA